MEVIAEERKKRSAAYRPPGIVITGGLFDMAAAVLLMATGTYETIRDLAHSHLDLNTQIQQIGATMLDCGVAPDMKMVEKLKRIVLQAQKYERECLREQQEKSEPAPPGEGQK